MKHSHAFTLVELLVVVAIIAVLAGLITGALAGVRRQGEATRCIAHLRLLAGANLAHAAENDGTFARAQERNNRVRWHGVRAATTLPFDPLKGPLAPYLGKEKRVKECPAMAKVLRSKRTFELGTGGYGYNAMYVGGRPDDLFNAARTGGVPRAGSTVMFADTAFPRADGLQEYAYAEPWQWVDEEGNLHGEMSPSVHFRHDGRANVAWCDGHVTAEKPSRLGKKNSYGGDAEKMMVGWFGRAEENGAWNPGRE